MVTQECVTVDPCCPPPMCAPAAMRYIQPPVPRSCKPERVYVRNNTPTDTETVYKTSYFSTHPCETGVCRIAPIRPISSLKLDRSVKMDGDTVTALSYPGHKGACRQAPIYPHSHQLLGTGPMQDLTTQKHDYVEKPIMRRTMIRPIGMMKLHPAIPMDKETVHRLSFGLPCNFSPSKSCKPILTYQQPCVPMNSETTHGCSYQPVCPPVKEIYPWARKAAFCLPSMPISKETTYKLSFMGGAGDRPAARKPPNTPCMITCDVGFDDRTVYRDSFLTTTGSCRPQPIRPPQQLVSNTAKMDGDTMYSLAYQGHGCHPRQQPIYPYTHSRMGTGPMQDLTTQKHDFVVLPICRRQPFRPINTLEKSKVPMDGTTTANASFMPITQFSPAVSCKPALVYNRPCVPMDTETTQKLSFQPVCPPPKEQHEWAQKASYRLPTMPMCTETVHNLSYAPPGRFVSCDGSGEGAACCVPPIGDQFPRAAVC